MQVAQTPKTIGAVYFGRATGGTTLTGLSAMMRAVPRSSGILAATSELGINLVEKRKPGNSQGP